MFLSLSKKDLLLICILVVLVLLLIIVSFIASFLVKKAKLNKAVREFKNRIDDLNLASEASFKASLKRLEVIALHNNEYQEIYDNYKNAFNEIVIKYKNMLISKSDEIIELNAEKKFKQVKEKLQESEIHYHNYDIKINELILDLQQYLSKDDECHDKSLKYKTSYAQIKEIYEIHQMDLKYVEESIQGVFKKIEHIFEEYENKCNEAKYDDAEKKIVVLDKVLPALKVSIEKLPDLCLRVYAIIPSKLKEMKELYEEYSNDGYSLNHLGFTSTYEQINIRLENLKKKLNSFNTKNVTVELNDIDEIINKFNDLLNKEKEAREFFEEQNEFAYNLSNEIEKRYNKVRRSIPEYKKYYEIDDKYKELTLSLQDKIQTLDKIRREFDNYVHSSSYKYPYTSLKAKLEELIKENEIIGKDLNDLTTYLKSLKNDANNAYDVLNAKFLSLKLLEDKLINMHIESLNEEFKDSFAQGYDYLNEMGQLISVCPIDMNKVNNLVISIEEIESSLKQEITEYEKSMIDAENAIFQANKYRQEFSDAKTNLNNAEEAFFAHDFKTACALGVETIKKANPKYRSDE